MSDYVLTENGVVYWPKCSIPYCPNRSCIRLNNDKCYPHTWGLKSDTFKSKKKETV